MRSFKKLIQKHKVRAFRTLIAPPCVRIDVAQVYKLRWSIETFFGWGKRHLKVYHLIARSPYGLMVQILGGLITYLLLAIYCREQHGEKISIHRVRELRMQIANEAAGNPETKKSSGKIRQGKRRRRLAKN